MLDGANTRSGGQVLADALRIHGVDTAFCVAGESYLELLDALFDHKDFKLYTCRQEGGAANMAEAYAKVTGKPGVVMVTRGPGACNASIGVHTAHQDSTPMIVLIGQVARDQFDREAFQEIDYRRMYGQLTKWVAQIENAERIPEYIARAFHVATSGRPGPVALALPEDMLRDRVAVGDTRPYEPTRAYPDPDKLGEMRLLLAKAERPLMLIGGGGWSEEARKAVMAFAERNDLPTCCSFRRLDLFDNGHPSFVGDLSTGSAPYLVKAVKDADLLIVAGARLGEITTQGYTLLDVPKPAKSLVHIHADAEEIGRVFQPTIGIESGMEQLGRALAALDPVDASGRREWGERLRAGYEEWTTPREYGGDLDLGVLIAEVQKRLKPDSIVTVDAGNFSGWAMRFLKYRRMHTFAGPTSGAMSYAVPAAVAASLAHPDRIVVGFAGDGGFMMSSQELATAMAYGAKPIMLVFNNGMYGTIRMHQEKHHTGRYIAVDLVNPEFQKLIEAYGGFGATITKTAEFGPALDAAIASGKPAVLDIRMDPNVISTTTTLDAMQKAAKEREAAGA